MSKLNSFFKKRKAQITIACLILPVSFTVINWAYNYYSAKDNQAIMPIVLTGLAIVIFFIGIWKVISPLSKYDKLIDSLIGVHSKLSDIALFHRFDNDVLSISVTNYDDYFLLMPLHFARALSKGMRLQVTTERCGSDLKAIQRVNDKNTECMFAIADPNYLLSNHFLNTNLVLISYMIKKVPLWLLRSPDYKDSKKSIRILTLSNDKNVFTGRIVLNYFSKEDIDTPTTIEDRLIDIYSHDENYPNSVLQDLLNDYDKSKFSLLLYAFVQQWKKETKRSIQDVFKEYDYIFLTDPEISFIKKHILTNYQFVDFCPNNKTGQTDEKSANETLCPTKIVFNKTGQLDEKGDVKLYARPEDELKDEKDFIFTAIIANKDKMERNPIAAMRFLRSLRIGILKTNIALSTIDSEENVMETFINYNVESCSDTLNQDRVRSFYKKAFNTLQKFNGHKELQLDESYFPNDLQILVESKSHSNEKMLGMYSSFLIKDSDVPTPVPKENLTGLQLIFSEILC